MEDTLSKFMRESAKRHEENSNLIKEIRASIDAAIRNQGASIKTLEIQIGQMSKYAVIQVKKNDSSFPSRLDNHYCEEERNYGPKFTEAHGASHINNAIPRNKKDPGSFTLPCFINDFCFDNALVDLGARVSVMSLSAYLNLGLGELTHTRVTVELADRTVKYPKGIAKNVLVGIGKFTFPVDFIILDILEDIKVPLILGRPFLSTARAKIDVYKRKFTLRVGKKRLFSKVLNLLVMVYKGDKVVGALMNVSIFVGTFSVMTDVAVLENMDAYHDDGIGDVIFGKPFLREIGLKTKRFKGIITLYNGNDEVTYQMVRSHPRFKCHTNKQCNKIPPLLKINEKDERNGISHAYQKLNGFYKGVLNPGPDYIRDEMMEE
ncbi:homeodomain-like protein [Tanacetum coccineum]